MTTLRVLVAAPPAADRAAPWALFDAAGRFVRTGRGRPADWPAAERVEAVVAATHVRLATVMLPPVPPGRLAAAALFALEDQVAAAPGALHAAVAPQHADGRVRVAIVERALVGAIAAAGPRRFERAVAEPELAAPGPGWRWCADADADGAFVRTADGRAFAASAPVQGAALPAELTVALAAAGRDGTRPAEVRVDARCAAADCARWQAETGIVFVPGTPWQWHAAPGAAFAAAIDLLQGDVGAPAPVAPHARWRAFRPAAWLAGAALALYVGGTLGEWAWLKVDAWRADRRWVALAESAGVPPAEAATAGAARAALAARYASLRHAQGQAAPDDALPLLARAAPALARLPAGAVRSAVFADGHWTVDLGPAALPAFDAFDAQMRAAGVPVLAAKTAAGIRARFGAS
jgi:general secretion pathway protein L